MHRLRSWQHPVSSLWRRARQTSAGRAFLYALLVVALLLPLWFVGVRWYRDQLLIGARAQMAEQVSLQSTALSSAISRRFALLNGLHAFVQTHPTSLELDAHFEDYAAALYTNVGGDVIRNITVAPGGVVIDYVYPRQGNERLLSYALLQDPRPEVRADLERALETRQIILSGPAELIEGGVGLVARQAVYQNDEFWGVVSITLNVTPFFAEAGMLDPDYDLSLALRDQEGQIFIGLPEVFDLQPVIGQIDLPDGSWQMAGVPTHGWQSLILAPLRLFQMATLLIVALLAGLTYLSANRQLWLAQAVEQRTQELSLANQQLQESHEVLEQRVIERTQEVVAQAEKMAVLEERQRIARELHDSVSQALYGIGLGARTASEALDEDHTGEARESIDYVLGLAEAGLAEMRALLLELRPEALEAEGLVAALTKQAASLRIRHQIDVQVDLGEEPNLPLVAKQALYRIAQEALHNVAKHAQASRVSVCLRRSDSMLSLEICDNGAGFDPTATIPGHMGLHSMRERVEALGGVLRIDSAPERGATVRAEIPLNSDW